MASIGQILPYNDTEEEFESYISRCELFFIANDITEPKLVPAFLTLVGPKVYNLAKNLVSPKEIASCSYEEIKTALKNHYKPKVIQIFERFKFYSRSQKSGESIADFVAALKALAHTCNFASTLNDMLRDRFVMGLGDERTQHTLLAEADLTFARAVEIATAREAARRDVQAMGRVAVNKVQHKTPHTKPRNTYNSSSQPKYNPSQNTKGDNTPKSIPNTPCSGCGKMHWRRDCPFKNATCNVCHRKGHIQTVCYQARKEKPKAPKGRNMVHFSSSSNTPKYHTPNVPNTANSDNDSSYDYVYSLRGKGMHNDDANEPILVNIFLDEAQVTMELDTGTAPTIISKGIFEKIWPSTKRPILYPSSACLRVYGGVPLTVCGELRVNARVEHSSESTRATIIVVQEDGPCLLGRKLINALNVLQYVNSIAVNSKSLATEFPELFSDDLGCYRGKTFSINVDPTVAAKFCKARTVPYTLREKVEKELHRLQQEGIISPISHSSWAAPVVPVLKADGSVRLCGDYKLTVNKAAKVDTYPIPSLHDLFSSLAGGVVFSKLDMSQAYAQLCLDDASKKYTVINTHRGLFEYNRLSFGISSAPGIFQRAMEELLRGIPGVFCYLDDILITASSIEQHNKIIKLVLSKLQDAGLKLKLAKCHIGVPSVSYLGHVIDKEGVHPTEEKLKAIVEAPAPTNITQLRAYLGLLNFYRRFLPQAATMLEPLNRLLKADTTWVWGEEQINAFRKSKELLTKSSALVHFDPKLPLVVVADSSSYGIGGVLCHLIDEVERPICFVSRTLSTAERNYSQLEKEALAMVFALRKFHYYLWGQANFTVITDHKPLLGLFSSTKAIPPMASGRIQRWALLLQNYKFTLRHRSGALLGTADALSRLPLPSESSDNTPVPAEWDSLVNFLDTSPVTSDKIRTETRKDPILSKVFKHCELGWSNYALKDSNLTPYVRRKEELSLQNGCVLWGSRVIIPTTLRRNILKELHSCHVGSSRMKELARSYLWWPNLDKDLEEVCNTCPECLSQRATPPKAELHPWEWPAQPWHRIHVDYAGPVEGRYFLIIVDAHSKWVDVYNTKGTTSAETIRCMQHSFSQFGLPISIVSDNGTCFTSQEFKEFAENSGIKHITTAVYKPSTNGLAERMVQTFKRALKKSNSSDIQSTIDRFLFNYRLTPHSTTGVSPAELMFGRRLRSRLDLLWPGNSIATRVHERQLAQKKSYTKGPRKVSFPADTPVMIRDFTPRGPKWIPSTIAEQTGPLSYRCTAPSGVVKRHQDQILPRNVPLPVSENSMPETSTPTPSSSGPPAVTDDCIGGSSSHSATEIPEGQNSPYSNSPRRSNRVRRPVDRLDL